MVIPSSQVGDTIQKKKDTLMIRIFHCFCFSFHIPPPTGVCVSSIVNFSLSLFFSPHPPLVQEDVSPLSLLASAISLGMIVTLLACIAQRFESSKTLTR